MRADGTIDDCIFCKIVRGEVPASKVYEDELVLAFKDIRPQAPVHVLVIPKRHIGSLDEATAGDAAALGRLLGVAPRIARENGSPDGFRMIVNNGRIGRQDVMHVHLHVIGGPERLGPMLPRA
jgi:histidine triad (HIT) family protein